MSQKTVQLPGIGDIILAKRRGAKNLRISVLPDGRVRVSMPTWVPYSTGLSFAASRSDWIKEHLTDALAHQLRDGHRIGKSYRLKFQYGPKPAAQARLGINSIIITSALDPNHIIVQTKAKSAAEKALKKEAQILLGARLSELSSAHGLPYGDFKVKKLTSRWGSCSSKGDITLNIFLVQLPWRLIDYVIVHELAHTIHHDHSRSFWRLVEKILPEAKALRREIKKYRPMIIPS
jgi:hypothetical protein